MISITMRTEETANYTLKANPIDYVEMLHNLYHEVKNSKESFQPYQMHVGTLKDKTVICDMEYDDNIASTDTIYKHARPLAHAFDRNGVFATAYPLSPQHYKALREDVFAKRGRKTFHRQYFQYLSRNWSATERALHADKEILPFIDFVATLCPSKMDREDEDGFIKVIGFSPKYHNMSVIDGSLAVDAHILVVRSQFVTMR